MCSPDRLSALKTHFKAVGDKNGKWQGSSPADVFSACVVARFVLEKESEKFAAQVVLGVLQAEP